MASIFKQTKPKDFIAFISDYVNIDSNVAEALIAFKTYYHRSERAIKDDTDTIDPLERRWYASLKTGKPDYSVYEDPYYLADLWACWAEYSRKHVLTLAKTTKKSVALTSLINNPKTIVDIGCGLGYTTAGLKELWPNARVVGTDIKDTTQYKIATALSKLYGFEMVSEPYAVGEVADIAFASEYFEHFYEPVAELDRIVGAIQPKVFITANSFTGRAIGHFERYKIAGEVVENTKTARLFNGHLKTLGYRDLRRGYWNNKPRVWLRT